MAMLRLRPALILFSVIIVLLLLYQGTAVYREYSALQQQAPPPPSSDSKRPPSSSPQNPPPPQDSPETEEKPAQDAPHEDPSDKLDVHSSSSPIQSPPPTPGNPLVDINKLSEVDWTRFAYLQYVTASEFLCCSVMIFESLNRLKSKADRVLLYPDSWGAPGDPSWKSIPNEDRKLMEKARDEYKVKLQPVHIIHEDGNERTWADGFTKLLAFNQTQYSRTIMLDSDGTLLQHLDHLFLLPPITAALPRAYWLMPNPPELHPQHGTRVILSAQFIVATPSKHVFERLLEALKGKEGNDYDMEIINWVLGGEAMVLPHRTLNLVSGEFKEDHSKEGYNRYLGIGGGEAGKDEKWDAKKVLEETRYVHFSDWPRPKPWYKPNPDRIEKWTPKCYKKPAPKSSRDEEKKEEIEDCSDRDAWLWLYSDYAKRRKDICGLDLLPPPALPAGVKPRYLP